jgi:hypothetical protein
VKKLAFGVYVALIFVFGTVSVNARSNTIGEAATLPTAATVAPRDGIVVEVTDLQPFTDIAYIPVGADLSSIRVEGLKVVKVETKRTSTADQDYCAQGFKSPGGSMFCPWIQDGSPMTAYRITYSYNGLPMSSDEYGGTHFTFSVNIRPQDLNPRARLALSAPKISRKALAEFFNITTSRDLVPRVVIDDKNSTLCAGDYSDGVWYRTDRNCEDKVTYKVVKVPSDYIAVKVNPAFPDTSNAANGRLGSSR